MGLRFEGLVYRVRDWGLGPKVFSVRKKALLYQEQSRYMAGPQGLLVLFEGCSFFSWRLVRSRDSYLVSGKYFCTVLRALCHRRAVCGMRLLFWGSVWQEDDLQCIL